MTIRFDGIFTYETTAIECPPWCELQAGHEMMHVPGGEVDRHHSWTFGTPPLAVEITDYETAESVDGPVISNERSMFLAPRLVDHNLSAADARRLAAALIDAAEALEGLPA